MLSGEAAKRINMDRNPTLLSAEERRPAALVVVSPVETISTKLIRDPFLRVPAVAISHAVGERLRQQNGRRLQLHLRARRYPSTGHNVIGRLPGEVAERIVVAAHYDTAADVPGATDNASGTAVVLALCEAFAASGPRRFGDRFRRLRGGGVRPPRGEPGRRGVRAPQSGGSEPSPRHGRGGLRGHRRAAAGGPSPGLARGASARKRRGTGRNSPLPLLCCQRSLGTAIRQNCLPPAGRTVAGIPGLTSLGCRSTHRRIPST